MIQDTPSDISAEGQAAVENINKSGDVVIDELYITKGDVNVSIKNFSPRFVIFEDMFTNFLSGELTIVDAGELIKILNFNGTEFLTINFRTPTTSAGIKRSFIIYALKDRMMSSTNREETYVLLFTSPENVLNNTLTISKQYSGKTDTIVKKIFNNYLKKPRIVDGKETKGETPLFVTDAPHRTDITFVAPYWSPTKAINYVAARSIGKKYKAPNFLFYETTRGFYFTSLEFLIAEQLKRGGIFATYVYSPTMKMIQDPSSFTFQFPEIAKQYSLVKTISPFTYFDVLQGQNMGYFSSFMYTHDIVLKEFRQFTYNHYKNYQEYYFMEDYKASGNNISESKGKNTRPFSKDTPASAFTSTHLRTKQYKLFDNFVDPQYQTWVQQRTSLLSQISSFKLHIQVSGRSDLEVGKLIYFVYPQAHTSGEYEAEFKIDKKISGVYMITAIKHVVTPASYEVVMEISKDSFFEAL